jgi:hypothetical protein
MPLLSKSLLGRVAPVSRKSIFDARRELSESASKSFKSKDRYDVFLSHRFLDAKEVLALKTFIKPVA